uniref:Uncharacterized protein n=1 Tax=Ananas comosus var. bracteatus TaxID=296719 RepID=A0A6V7PP55_ANACO|nr:unnamed protein product [Ananas comosus var. bracteatus]
MQSPHWEDGCKMLRSKKLKDVTIAKLTSQTNEQGGDQDGISNIDENGEASLSGENFQIVNKVFSWLWIGSYSPIRPILEGGRSPSSDELRSDHHWVGVSPEVEPVRLILKRSWRVALEYLNLLERLLLAVAAAAPAAAAHAAAAAAAAVLRMLLLLLLLLPLLLLLSAAAAAAEQAAACCCCC